MSLQILIKLKNALGNTSGHVSKHKKTAENGDTVNVSTQLAPDVVLAVCRIDIGYSRSPNMIA